MGPTFYVSLVIVNVIRELMRDEHHTLLRVFSFYIIPISFGFTMAWILVKCIEILLTL